MYRTFSVSHQKDEGFILHLYERSSFRDGVYLAFDKIDEITGHHLCNSWFLRLPLKWSDKVEKVLLSIPIDREKADALARNGWDWSWLDEDENDIDSSA